MRFLVQGFQRQLPDSAHLRVPFISHSRADFPLQEYDSPFVDLNGQIWNLASSQHLCNALTSRTLRKQGAAYSASTLFSAIYLGFNTVTIPLPYSTDYNNVYLLGAGVNGGTSSQSFTVTYSDGDFSVALPDRLMPLCNSASTSTWTQGFGDCASFARSRISVLLSHRGWCVVVS